MLTKKFNHCHPKVQLHFLLVFCTGVCWKCDLKFVQHWPSHLSHHEKQQKSTHALALCAGVDVNASPAEQPCKRPVKWYRTPRYLTGCISVCWTNARILPFLLCLPIQLTSANRHHCVSGPSSVFPLSVLIFTRFRGSAQSHDYLGYECSINWLNWSRWRISVGCWLIHLRY